MSQQICYPLKDGGQICMPLYVLIQRRFFPFPNPRRFELDQILDGTTRQFGQDAADGF